MHDANIFPDNIDFDLSSIWILMSLTSDFLKLELLQM